MKISALAIFCGSKSGNDPIYIEHAKQLGKLLAEKKIPIIYGGGGKGIMGTLADAVMENSGRIVGVIPQGLVDKEHQHKNITEMTVVDDMHVRKKKMYELCDAAIILPGGFGTLDELFEILTWNQLSLHDKTIFILNSGGFYDHLLQHIFHLEKNGFLYDPADEIKILIVPEDFLAYLD